jgi:hypothetical protein
MKILIILFIVGAGALMFCVTGPYPVLGAGPILLGVGILLLFAASTLTTAAKYGGGEGAPRKSVWGVDGAHYILIALTPWLLAAVLVANGAFDHSQEVDYQTVLVDQDFGRWWDYLTVQSWRPGRTTETLYVKTGFNIHSGRYWPGAFFFPGQPITIGVRSGAFRMPWICRISQGQNNISYPGGPTDN